MDDMREEKRREEKRREEKRREEKRREEKNVTTSIAINLIVTVTNLNNKMAITTLHRS
jgi:hypothetical protein